MGDLTNQKAPNVEPIKLKIMEALNIKNFPESMVNVLVENKIAFVYECGNITVLGTSCIGKLKALLIKIGMTPSVVESLNCKVVELYYANDIYAINN